MSYLRKNYLEDLDTYQFNDYGLPARSRYTDTHTTYSNSRSGYPVTTTHTYHHSSPYTTYTSTPSIADLPPSPHYTRTKAETWHGRAIPTVAHKRLTVTQPPPRSVHRTYTDITETDRVMKRIYPTGHTDSYCNMRYADPDSNLRDYVGSDGEIQSRYYVSDGYRYRDHYPTIERRWMSDMKRGDTQVNHKYIVVPSVRDVYNDIYHKSLYTKAHEGANLGKVIPRRRNYYDDDKVKNDVALLSGYGETVGAVKEHRMNQDQWFRNVMDGIRHLKSSYNMPKGNVNDHLRVMPYHSGTYTPPHTPLEHKFADYIYGLRDHRLVKVNKKNDGFRYKEVEKIVFPWEKPYTPIYDVEHWARMAQTLDVLWAKVINPIPVVSKWRKIVAKNAPKCIKNWPVFPRAPFAPSEAVKKAELRADDYDRSQRANRSEALAREAAMQDFTPRSRRQATEEEPAAESKIVQEEEVLQDPEVTPEEVEATPAEPEPEVAVEPEVSAEPEAPVEPVEEEPKEETKEERKLRRAKEREAKRLAKLQDEAPAPVEEVPATVEETPVAEEAPVVAEEEPAPVEEVPVEEPTVEEEPVVVEEEQAVVEESPIAVEEPAAVEAPEAEEPAAPVEEEPVTVEEAPVEVESVPVEEETVAVEEEPEAVEEAPVAVEEAPAAVEEEPAAVEEVPAEVEEPAAVEEAVPEPEVEAVVEETPAEETVVEEEPVESAPVEEEQVPAEDEPAEEPETKLPRKLSCFDDEPSAWLDEDLEGKKEETISEEQGSAVPEEATPEAGEAE